MFTEKRVPKYVEKLSTYFMWIGALGCAYVIVDPSWSIGFGDYLKLASSGDGFSSDTKGMVVGIAIVGTLVAVQKFWLPGTDESKKQSESVARIAEASAPTGPDLTAALKANTAATSANSAAQPVIDPVTAQNIADTAESTAKTAANTEKP